LTGVEETSEKVRVYSKNDQFEASYLIAADGANSQTAQSLGLHKPPIALALTAEIQAPMEVCSQYRERALINFGENGYHYAWVFPKKGRLSAGVITRRKEKTRLKEGLVRFIQDLNLLDYPYSLSGHPLPDFRNRKIHTNRIILAGDAAGLCDPFSGEGIRYAIHSGYLAAKHIFRALSDPRHRLSNYNQEVKVQITDRFQTAFRLAELVYSHPKTFSWILPRAPYILHSYLDIISGQTEYSDLLKHIFLTMKKLKCTK
jgi:flavin-dependent dehydrogenase